MKPLKKNALIVSCQAEENEPLHGSVHMQKMAVAAVESGAMGIRANTAEDVRAIKAVVDVPVIGIIKDRQYDYEAFITTRPEHAKHLIEAGADYVAIDASRVSRPVALKDLISYIRTHFKDTGIVADIADIEDARQVATLNPDYLSTTLSSYTEYTKDRPKPDLELIAKLTDQFSIPVLAEGNYQSPEQVRKALLNGAYSVIVGGAITRPQQITKRFTDALEDLQGNILAIGIDLGATHTRAVLTDRQGTVKAKLLRQTPETPDLIVKNIVKMIEALKAHDQLTAVGIASAGRTDIKSGTIVYATDNIPDWTGRKLGLEIYNETGYFPAIDNDANFAAYAEWSKNNFNSLGLMTIGTGIGGGIVINGNILRGSNGGGGEIGHIIYPGNQLPCTCGKNGCIETLVSGKALQQQLNNRNGDKANVLKAYSKKIAWLIDTVNRIVEVEKFFVGGVAVRYGEQLLELFNQELVKIDSHYDDFVQFSTLGELSGAIGAALYALDQGYKQSVSGEKAVEEECL